ncbi:MAG: site-2 protease family protein [Acidimicrobiia bacterium]
MEQTVTIGHWRGIRIGAHWSLLIVAWLLAYSLAVGLLPDRAAGHSDVAYWVTGSITSLVFLLAIGAHEMGHAVVALRRQMHVNSVTLWLFGGIAELADQARSWRAELAVAVAGPSVSAVFGALCAGGGLAIDVAGGSALVAEALIWLGTTNLVLAAFNLLPGAPLDGGRVLAAIRWRTHGDPVRARREAALAGMAIGRTMLAAGILLVFLGVVGSGMWIGFLGWFLYTAARNELGAGVVNSGLEGVKVSDAMTSNPVVIPPDMTLSMLVDDVLPRTRGSSFPVVGATGLCGLMTYAKIHEVPMGQWATKRVVDVALPLSEVIVADPDDDFVDVLHQLHDERRRVLAVRDGRVVGIISPSDVTRVVQRELLRHRVDVG